ICSLGEFVAAHGDRATIARVYESLLPRHSLCGHWGLLGMRWGGPAARVLGLLAAALGRLEEADAHFTEAMDIARRMGAKPWMDRINNEWKAARKPPEAASTSARGIPAVDYFGLARDGDVWVCECEGKSFRLRDSRGMQMLARLVAEPGRDLHVLDLAGA